MKEQDHIDNLYKNTFANYKIAPNLNHWDSVYKIASKKNFFKPNYKNFNFIYAFLITSTFAFSLSIFIDYFFLNNDAIIPSNSLNIIYDSSLIKTIYVRDTIYHQVAINKDEEKILLIDTAQIIDSYLNNNKINNINSIEKISAKTYNTENEIQIKKEKNINVIYKTIEKKDTVVLYKEKPIVSGKKKGIFDVRNR